MIFMEVVNITNNRYGNKDDTEKTKKREFLLVKSLNINIDVFTGYNLHKNPYIPFNKALGKSIMAQRCDGDGFLKFLDHVEIYGDTKFTNVNLRALYDVYPKAYEYARAIYAALLNWIGGAAQGVVEHGCDNGFDAWRRLCNRYIPGVDDLQNLFMEELMLLLPVSEQEIDGFFTEVERIMEWHTKTDVNGQSMNAKWVRAALVKNLFKIITQHLAIELRKVQTIDAVYNLVMVYLHDHNTVLPRHQTAARLHLTEEPSESTAQSKTDEKKPDTKQKRQDDSWNNDIGNDQGDLSVAKGIAESGGTHAENVLS